MEIEVCESLDLEEGRREEDGWGEGDGKGKERRCSTSPVRARCDGTLSCDRGAFLSEGARPYRVTGGDLSTNPYPNIRHRPFQD
jgi:hypothetical protein